VSLQAVDEMLKKALDDGGAAAQRASYKKLSLALTDIGARLAAGGSQSAGEGSGTPGTEQETRQAQDPPRQVAPDLEETSDFVDKSLDEGTRPKALDDRQRIESMARNHAQAFVTSQNPSSSDKDRQAAEKELDRPARSAKNPKYQEILDQAKKYKAPAGCVSLMERRTNQAGWTTGSLWGLADAACERPRKAGAEDTSSKWNDLFVCVDKGSFSKCRQHVPED
jgi:hypothetical protein